MAALVATTVAAGGVGNAQQGSGPRIDLRLLLITDDPSVSPFEAWVDLLGREQVPYDVLDVSSGDTLTEQDLRSGDRAFYQAVVCSTECGDILTVAELAALDAFQASFGIRRVNAYAWPGRSRLTGGRGALRRLHSPVRATRCWLKDRAARRGSG